MSETGRLGIDGLGEFGLGESFDGFIRQLEEQLAFSDSISSEVEWGWSRPFDLGGIGEIVLLRPFNLEYVPIEFSLHRLFNVVGSLDFALSRPFDLIGEQVFTLSRPFDVVEAITAPPPAVYVPLVEAPVATTLASGSSIGATTVVVTSATGIVVGMVLSIGGEFRVVTVVAGTTITLAVALGVAHAGGSSVTSVSGYVEAIAVFDKAGTLLGLLPEGSFTIEAAPSRVIGGSGSMRFSVPRNSPHRALLKMHRLLMLSNSLGMTPWAGSIESRRWSSSQLLLVCKDLTATLGGRKLDVVDDASSDVPAVGLYQVVLNAMNTQRAADGELVWERSVTGSRIFRGDVDMRGQPWQLFEEIAERSSTEWAWEAALVAGPKLRATLLVRDQFVAATGATLTDVRGSSNVVSSPVLSEDSEPMAHSLRLIGRSTRLEDELSGCFDWAVGTLTPEVIVTRSPGEYRNEEPTEVHVPWGFSKGEKIAAADQIRNQVSALFEPFLYAWHDQGGRPFHEGWRYEGPPSELEPFLHTGLGWRTNSKFVNFQGQAASSVMINRSIDQILLVLYDRVTAVKQVRRSWFSETGDLQAIRMHVHGLTPMYTVQSGVIVSRSYTTFDHSSALVSEPALYMWPGEGEGSDHPSTTYHRIRRVISITEEGAVTEGMYFDDALPFGPTTGAAFTRPTIGDPPHKFFTLEPLTTGVASEAISRVWDFERRRICDWDPRRDGIGAQLNRETVVNNAPTTSLRWHLVPWGTGGDGITTLSQGIAASTTQIIVDSILSLPTAYPYKAIIDDGLSEERVNVTGRSAGALTVVRAIDGSTAIIHEGGARFQALDQPEWNGLPVEIDWPSGLAYANELLDRLDQPLRRMTVQVTNRDDTWRTVTWGSVHVANLTTEGDTLIDGDWRVLGWAPSGADGVMELLLEETT